VLHPKLGIGHLVLSFIGNTQLDTHRYTHTSGRTPLNVWSAFNHKPMSQASVPPEGYGPAILATADLSLRPHNHRKCSSKFAFWHLTLYLCIRYITWVIFIIQFFLRTEREWHGIAPNYHCYSHILVIRSQLPLKLAISWLRQQYLL
jgi:hypothetical protein